MANESMDVSIILTYRCNSRCTMCNIWKSPTLPTEEITLKVLDKLPYGINNLNLTGGEPTLRADLAEIADLLYPRAKKLEVSSNGQHPERLYPIIQKHPDMMVRFSLEGFAETNDSIRGEKDGFETKVNGLLKLKELGGRDLGFAITVQDENADQLVPLFEFAQKNGFELATSTLHNGFQFHKNDNALYNRPRAAGYIEDLITAQLKTNSVKTWFRAYLNLGIAARALGQPRLLPCTAGTTFAFIDPWGDVFACNVRPDLKVGNLFNQEWDEIINGPAMQEVRRKVAACTQNCWMVGSAKTAMRNPRFTSLPRWTPMKWVVVNKVRVMLGGKVNIGKVGAQAAAQPAGNIPRRVPYLVSNPVKRKVELKEAPHYTDPGGYENH